MAMSRQKKLDNMELIEKQVERVKPEFDFHLGRTPGRFLFETKGLVIGYDTPLSKPLDFVMERKEKVLLTGANGIGKTTLLKSLLGLIPPLEGQIEKDPYMQIGYFEQEMSQDVDTTCIEEIGTEFPSWTSGKCERRWLAAVSPQSTLKAEFGCFPVANRPRCACAS